MDGLELIRRLRKDITTAFIPVIILSQKNAVADRLKGFAVGTDDYLPKPFSFQEVFFRINAILKRVYSQLGQ
jgi:two-component system phosphate regulon response regulator PhoB